MKSWLVALDRILRGETTRAGTLKEGLREVPLGGITIVIVCLGAVYGFGMGTFALFKEGGPVFAQFIASAVKVPLLFFLTLLVTFPSLYVFNALVGSRLDLQSVLRLLVAGMAVTLAVLASFGPIVAFFSASTTSYPFMVLLNVAMCAAAGLLGLSFLRQTMHRFSLAEPPGLPATPATPPAPASMEPGASSPLQPRPPTRAAGPLDHTTEQPFGLHVRGVFRCWIVLFALVGSQMGWVLRPFIGRPELPFTLFRPRESNFFVAVWELFLSLFA